MNLTDMEISMATAVKAAVGLVAIVGIYYTLQARDTAIAGDAKRAHDEAKSASELAGKNTKAIESLTKSMGQSSSDLRLLTQELRHSREMRKRELGEIQRSLDKVERRTRGFKAPIDPAQ